MADKDPSETPVLPARLAERGDVQALLATRTDPPVGWVHVIWSESADSSYITVDSALDMVLSDETTLTWSRDCYGYDLLLEFGSEPAIRLGISDPSRKRTDVLKTRTDTRLTIPVDPGLKPGLKPGTEPPAEPSIEPGIELGLDRVPTDFRVLFTATMPAEHWFFLKMAASWAGAKAHERGPEWERIAGEITLPVTGLTWEQVSSPRDPTVGVVREIIARVGATDPVALTAALLAAGFTPPAVSLPRLSH